MPGIGCPVVINSTICAKEDGYAGCSCSGFDPEASSSLDPLAGSDVEEDAFVTSELDVGVDIDVDFSACVSAASCCVCSVFSEAVEGGCNCSQALYIFKSIGGWIANFLNEGGRC